MKDFDVEHLVMNSVKEIMKHDCFSKDQAIKIVEIAYKHRQTHSIQELSSVVAEGVKRVIRAIEEPHKRAVESLRRNHY